MQSHRPGTLCHILSSLVSVHLTSNCSISSTNHFGSAASLTCRLQCGSVKKFTISFQSDVSPRFKESILFLQEHLIYSKTRIITVPGQVFSYGEHFVTYIATDAAGNSASCSFKLFVLRKYFTSLTSCSSPTHIIHIHSDGRSR